MTAEVRIFVEQIEKAVQIPVHAVYETKRHHFVLVRDGEKWDTREIKIGATNDKFVTVKDGISANDNVVLDPRNHLDKMDIPEIKEEDDRSKLVAMSNEPLPKPAGGVAAPGAGGPGAGGSGGGMSSDALVGMIMQRMDSNSDGSLSKEEVAGEERMKNAFADYDANKDGKVDRAELAAAMKKRMAAMGGGAGGPGGGGGAGRGPGAPAN
jgi:hypothetical protein